MANWVTVPVGVATSDLVSAPTYDNGGQPSPALPLPLSCCSRVHGLTGAVCQLAGHHTILGRGAAQPPPPPLLLLSISCLTLPNWALVFIISQDK